ncbi:hydroxymethylbilane synthase [Burkholderia multivorans]|uniref:hydroxymethylbilane synthase n=1 Tax=Burkholderia multivorans TaxID=87883 RepID=UPI000DAD7A13|nr:hydroxymethylbilane synthase [Burkholderia multivorans]RAB13819.1 hydroxymethylbilane synthase [Burkholderia multivorans]
MNSEILAAGPRPAQPPATLTIASRESRLAMWQAEHVRDALRKLYPACDVKILGMTTRGDQILDRTLSKVGGKGLFVKELESALADGRADLAVHSLKDVPMMLPAGSASSLRREAMLRARYPQLQVLPLRGNLDTRLSKLDRGDYAAIILAAAGLKRLGLEARIRALLDVEDSPPAAGQGALGIEIAAHRTDVAAWLEPLHDAQTALAVEAERMVSRALGGSCEVPLAAHAVWRAGELYLTGRVSTIDGTRVLTAEECASVVTVADALALGRAVSDELEAQGALEIVRALLAGSQAGKGEV